MYDSYGLTAFLSTLLTVAAVFWGFKIIQGFFHRGEPSSSDPRDPGFLSPPNVVRQEPARQIRRSNVVPIHRDTIPLPIHRNAKPIPIPIRKIREEVTSLEQGEQGEYLIFESLDRLDGKNRILVNLYLPQGDGTTTEVDLVMINNKGIHVFESKYFSGWIFGSEESKYWTQVLLGGKKHQFYNPIWQNAGHIRAISSLCPGIPGSSFFSYIIFSDRCGLKELHVANPDVFIGYRYELTRLFSSIVSRKPDRLTDAQVEEVYGVLRKFIHVDAGTREKHIRQFEDKSKK